MVQTGGIGNQVLKKNGRAALIDMAGQPRRISRNAAPARARNSIRHFRAEWLVRFPHVGITGSA